MKMYVFPGDESLAASDLKDDRPLFSAGIDATLMRLSTFMLAWSAGAGAAAFLVLFF